MIIKRVGGKTKIAPWIASNLPDHKIFVDVFGGSGAVLEAVMPDCPDRHVRYVFNDLDRKIFNLFRVLRDKPAELATEISTIPYSRDEFEQAIELLADEARFQSLGEVDQSIVFLIANRQSFGAKMGRPWSITLDGEVNYQTWDRLPGLLIKTARRFKNVFLENLDYRDLLKKWDSKQTCFYLDPPYEGVEEDYYEVNRESGFNHDEMFCALQSIEGSYVVSYYGGENEQQDTPLIKKYREVGCKVLRRKVSKHLSSKDNKSTATEVLLVHGKRSGRRTLPIGE